MEKTTNYDQFKFRNDNREKINLRHVEKLKKSIEAMNLLHLCPIIVNGEMEVIDGQHRLLAAKNLGLPVWFRVEKKLGQAELITLQCSKKWSLCDYLNLYIKQGKEEYIKFKRFMEENNVNASIALRLNGWSNSTTVDQFKSGNLKMRDQSDKGNLSHLQDVISTLRNLKGSNETWLASTRMKMALLRLLSHENYNHEKFLKNINRLLDTIDVKATEKGYAKMFQNVFNWRNNDKIIWELESPKE